MSNAKVYVIADLHFGHKKLDDDRYRCVSAEQIDYTPILMEEVLR